MQIVANAIFNLPFDVHFRTRGATPIAFESRASRFVLHLPEDETRGPSMTTKEGDEAWSTKSVSVEIPCDFGDPTFDESRISDQATILIRSFLDIFRWRAHQPQIVPSIVRHPSSVQYFDRDRVGPSGPVSGHVPVLIPGSIVGGALVAPPSGAAIHIFSTIPEIAGPFPSDFGAKIGADLDAGVSIPLWEDYILGAQRRETMPRRVTDLGIAAEVFIDHYLDPLIPNWERRMKRSVSKQGKEPSKIELGYRYAIIKMKARDIGAEKPTAYEQVRYLYRARNSAAHSGVAKFLDDTGIQYVVTDAHLKSFQAALLECIRWLENLP